MVTTQKTNTRNNFILIKLREIELAEINCRTMGEELLIGPRITQMQLPARRLIYYKNTFLYYVQTVLLKHPSS